MTWLEFIGKIIKIGVMIVFTFAAVIVLAVMFWLAIEQYMGRNPFL